MVYCDSQAQLAKETLHDVIFYALLHKEDYNTDFDVPSFENCMTVENYMDLIQHFTLYTYLKRELWNMGREPALTLLEDIFRKERNEFSMLYKNYMQLLLELKSEKQFYERLNVFKDIISSKLDISQLLDLVFAIYERLEICMKVVHRKKAQAYKTMHRSFTMLVQLLDIYSLSSDKATEEEQDCMYNTLFTIVQSVKKVSSEDEFKKEYEAIESRYHLFQNKKDTKAIIFDYNNYEYDISEQIDIRLRPTLKEYMSSRCVDDELSRHEHVFVSIVEYICLESLPNQRDQVNALSAEEDNGMERLENVIQEKYGNRPQMMNVFYNCVYIIRHRSMFWKSILKVIVQFLDLWIGVIEEARCADIFSSWISRENMLQTLYKHILKHVQHYDLGTSTNTQVINKLTSLLEKSLDFVETNEKLLAFRDFVFHNSSQEEVHMPILGLTLFWNIPFDQELTRVTNQITSVEEDVQVPEDIMRKLIKLSVVWPYEVLRQLFLSSIHNKNQYKAIVPILHNLGGLCMLKKRNGDTDSDGKPLLLLILKEFLSPANSDALENYKENILQFMKACCSPARFQNELPLILMPISMVDQTLLPLQSVLTECILQNLSTSCHIKILEFSLHGLNMFCESPLNDWTTILHSSDLPTFLYCSPETYLIFLTDILSLRFTHDERPRLPLQVWESALKIVYRFFDLIQFALKTEQFPRIHQFFMVDIKKYDWKAQLIWYNVTQSISKHSLNVPSPFFQITGALGDLFVEDKSILPTTQDANEGWYDIITACRLSPHLSDELFEHKDQWTYNLLLLWNHPYEDKLLLKCLEHTLHPKTSLSVPIEYDNLLVHFLNNLYLSFPGARQAILDSKAYENAQILPIVRDLSHVGTRNYFIILYITLLIRKQIEAFTEEDKYVNYFVSHLVKLLQSLTNWRSISQPTKSYNELKSIGAKLIPSSSVELPGDTFGAQSKLEAESEVESFQYPLLITAELISNRALSILTLFHMCSILIEVKDDQQRQSIDRFVMMIMEGLIDTPSQQLFQRMLQQQPKSRVKLWKQKKSNTKFLMKMRPIISEEEKSLLKPVIEKLPNSSQISQALGLTMLHEEQSKKSYLYFLN
ncbi:unnamed protein product [Mucor hiemalis]